MIQTHLSEELSKLKLTMDEQIKETDEIMNKKLLVLEGGAASGKGGKGSGKGKKKWLSIVFSTKFILKDQKANQMCTSAVAVMW